MFDYRQHLREATLDSVKDKPVEDKATALNMIEAIIEDKISIDEMVDAIGNGTLSKRYVPATETEKTTTTIQYNQIDTVD
jgi:hypothetical protein